LEGEREKDGAAAEETSNDPDIEMSAADMDTTDQIERSTGIDGMQSQDGAAQSMVQTSRAGSAVADATLPQARAPKKRMIITHDKYMTLQSLIVLHLSATERETGRGIDRDELVDWYLELKESEIQDIEELEYEKELITKMLKKLVKVKMPLRVIDSSF
jgi:DNA replication licensing factor MCM6